jgi:TRAP-type C4-dicarboxylate transport system permease small subunit
VLVSVDERVRRGLVWFGGIGLLVAMVTDTLAMLGRHLRMPLIGSIEIVQCAVLVAASASLVLATQHRSHARVHLLLDRLSPAALRRAERLNALAGALFTLALLAGSVWIAADLWRGHEESELLRIPYRPLRIVVALMLAALAIINVRRLFGKPVR